MFIAMIVLPQPPLGLSIDIICGNTFMDTKHFNASEDELVEDNNKVTIPKDSRMELTFARGLDKSSVSYKAITI